MFYNSKTSRLSQKSIILSCVKKIHMHVGQNFDTSVLAQLILRLTPHNYKKGGNVTDKRRYQQKGSTRHGLTHMLAFYVLMKYWANGIRRG